MISFLPIKDSIKIITFYLTLLCFGSTYAQLFDVEKITTLNNEGSASIRNKLYIDKDGFLWYSTMNGVVKEMGSDRQLFAYNLPKNLNEVFTCYDILKTTKEELWSLTYEGINVLDLNSATSKWHNVYYPDTKEKVIFTSIIENKDGLIWLGASKNYIYSFDVKSGFIPYKTKDKLSWDKYDEPIYTYFKCLTKEGIVYQQGNDWFILKDKKSHLLFKEKNIGIQKNNSFKIVDNGSIFYKNKSGTYTYNNNKYSYKFIRAINKQVIELPFLNDTEIIKRNDSLFFATLINKRLELYSFKLENGLFNLLLNNSYTAELSFTNFTVSKDNHFYIDNFNGITKLKFNTTQFKTALTSATNKHGDEISCRSIVENTNGDLYVLSYSGIYKRKKGNNNWIKITPKLQNRIGNNTSNIVISSNYGMLLYDNNILLLYGPTNLLHKFNLLKNTVDTFFLPNEITNIRDIVRTKTNWLHISSINGYFKYNLNTKEYIKDERLTMPLNDFFLEDELLYITTANDGLFIKNLETDSIRTINNKNYDLINNQVKKIYKDTDKNYWIGTKQGLQKFNSEFNKNQKFLKSNGLINDHIIEFQEDDSYIWASTYEGLLRINKTNNKIKTFFKHDGLPHNEFNSKSSFKTSNDTIIFGGLNGLVKFKYIPETSQQIKPKLFLISYKLYNKDTKQNIETYNLLNESPDFNINYGQNYLALKFAINDIIHPKKNSYQYRIKELSNDWVDLGSFNTVLLEGLKPYKYTLDVRGYNSRGIVTDTKSYTINIEEIFYKQLWFLILIAVILWILLYWFITYRNNKIRTLYQQKNKINQLEAKAMRAQMNPHFIFNTLNGMQSVMILKGEREANKYFSAFSKLLRLTLDMNNTEHISLTDEISYINSYLELENLRLDERLSYSINIDNLINLDKNTIPCMMLQPIIENALIHGLTPKKENLNLDIDFIDKNHFITVEITDNGIGREASAVINEKSRKNHKSWATHIMNERINLSNDLSKEKITFQIIDLKDEAENSIGTKVILKLPKTFHPIKKFT